MEKAQEAIKGDGTGKDSSSGTAVDSDTGSEAYKELSGDSLKAALVEAHTGDNQFNVEKHLELQDEFGLTQEYREFLDERQKTHSSANRKAASEHHSPPGTKEPNRDFPRITAQVNTDQDAVKPQLTGPCLTHENVDKLLCEVEEKFP